MRRPDAGPPRGPGGAGSGAGNQSSVQAARRADCTARAAATQAIYRAAEQAVRADTLAAMNGAFIALAKHGDRRVIASDLEAALRALRDGFDQRLARALAALDQPTIGAMRRRAHQDAA